MMAIAVGISNPHERGVPMPTPAAVVVESQVLPQPLDVGRPPTIGLIGGHRIGSLVEIGETRRGGLGHEGHDAGHAGRLPASA